ncbi:hypothetical protein CsatA_015316 [Cannabis sativa]
MATKPSSSLHLPNPFPLAPSSSKPRSLNFFLSFKPRATGTDTDSDSPPSDSSKPTTQSDDFEDRLSQVRLRYRSGTGKKAEIRKTRKSKKSTSSPASIYLPPVPLKEPMAGRVKVDFGFSPYSERLNGRLAILGLTALLLVELATGKSVINYHTPSIVFVQVYFVAAATALYVKFQKESVSVWPNSSSKE